MCVCVCGEVLNQQVRGQSAAVRVCLTVRLFDCFIVCVHALFSPCQVLAEVVLSDIDLSQPAQLAWRGDGHFVALRCVFCRRCSPLAVCLPSPLVGGRSRNCLLHGRLTTPRMLHRNSCCNAAGVRVVRVFSQDMTLHAQGR